MTRKNGLACLTFINYIGPFQAIFCIYCLSAPIFNVLEHYFHILLDSISKKGSNLATFFASENRSRQTSLVFRTVKLNINLNIYTLIYY